MELGGEGAHARKLGGDLVARALGAKLDVLDRAPLGHVERGARRHRGEAGVEGVGYGEPLEGGEAWRVDQRAGVVKMD